MRRFLSLLIEIDTSSDKANQEIEEVLEKGANIQGYNYEKMEVKDSTGAEIAVKLTKEE